MGTRLDALGTTLRTKGGVTWRGPLNNAAWRLSWDVLAAGSAAAICGWDSLQ